jgi:hypothetical protein
MSLLFSPRSETVSLPFAGTGLAKEPDPITDAGTIHYPQINS